jgi:sporulation protein YlmC with PRC-barrel domain
MPTLPGGGTTPNGHVRISEQVGILEEVGPGDAPLPDPVEDVRGREVRDRTGALVGRVSALLVDDREQRVRLLCVAAPDRAPGWLVPVDAVSRIAPEQVTLNRTLAHVTATPVLDRAPMTQRHLESVYAHYGLYPYWSPGYVYPTYPAY